MTFPETYARVTRMNTDANATAACPADLLPTILAAIAAGHAVHVCTATRRTVVSPRTAKRFAGAGVELFSARGRSLYMAAGKSKVCIDYARVFVVPANS